MMTSPTQGHYNEKTGDFDFPLWAKVVAGVLAICAPLGIMLASWLTVAVIEMRTEIRFLVADKFTRSEFVAYSTNQSERDSAQNERLKTLEEYHRDDGGR